MKRKLALLITLALVCLMLLPAAAFADAGDLDEIVKYDVAVTPNVSDGSLFMTTTVDWKVLDQGPVEWVQIGIPNGSVTDLTANTSSVDHMNFDSSYVYIYFDRGYQDGETIHFSYSWTQSYMYTLDGSKVSFSLTPGWFDSARVDEMTITWNSVAGAEGAFDAAVSGDTDTWADNTAADGTYTVMAQNLAHGTRVSLNAAYAAWPVNLNTDKSQENLPSEYQGDYGNDYYGDDYNNSIGEFISGFVILAFIIIFIIITTNARRAWAGGFGTRYVFVNGLYYPMGHDGRPRPGSVGTPHKPTPPPPSHGGGIGGGRGGFGGGGGIGGGGHCACASSCACACACACAGGGRAGCSAKNLYGAIHLKDELPVKGGKQ